jgi:hypothetical protein
LPATAVEGVSPPLRPPSARVLTLYEYASISRADHDRAYLYPATADEQPAIILAKSSIYASQYSRAYCGFEPWRLRLESHLKLAKFVLLHHLRVGSNETP